MFLKLIFTFWKKKKFGVEPFYNGRLFGSIQILIENGSLVKGETLSDLGGQSLRSALACHLLCPRHLSWQQEIICLNHILGRTIPEMKVSIAAS